MFKRFFLFFIFVCSSMHSMRMEDFNVVVLNNFGKQIEVHYTVRDKEFVRVVDAGKHLSLGKASTLHNDIKIYRAGEFLGSERLSGKYAIEMNGLLQLWDQKRHHIAGADTLELRVQNFGRVLDQIGVKIEPATFKQIEVKEFREQIEGDVLDQFSGFDKYKWLKKELTPERILAIKSWKEEVVPAGWIARATTGEDIARYILGLPSQYNNDSVNKAYTTLSLRWHPDRHHLPGMKDFGQKVMPLIIHARDLLQEALRDKGQR